jgi:amino-acid N-acetyltransferase
VNAPAIRPAVRADVAGIEQLLKDADLPVDGVAGLIEQPPHAFIVAESGGRLAGVAGLEVCGEHALLRSVAVSPHWRSSGVGREFVQRLIGIAEDRGLQALYLLTSTAERYFPRFGFDIVDRADVPRAIAETVEFKSLCPSSATVMVRPIYVRSSTK